MTDRQRLIDANEAAAAFYRANVESPLGAGPRRYLAERRLDRALDDLRWTIGYAPAGWTRLLAHLDEQGFSYTEIHAAGLTIETRRGSLIDRFRDRITLGIRNHGGDLVGFVGRCSPAAASDTPKYLNSPKTDFFTKGHQLFGLAEQRDRLRAGATSVLVEGPLDVLAVGHLDRDFAAVSTCGTALRPDQVQTLRAHSGSKVIVAYDSDEAGHKASRTAYRRLAPLFDRVLGARLPDGQDPASLTRTNPGAMRQALNSASPLADHLVDDVLSHYQPKLDNAEARICALHESTRLIARLRPCDVGRQVARVADRLALTPNEVTSDLLEAVTAGRNLSTAHHTVAALHDRARQPRTTRQLAR